MTISHETTTNRSEAGFTLVELAVVMIIIGLLIGGVLKGQELINNAQITATVSQVKALDAATTTFRDMYDALPGDMTNPGARLPGCAANPTCAVAGDGNTRIDAGDGNATLLNIGTDAPSGEGLNFFLHLAAADLVTGINPNNGAVWGGNYPVAQIGGGFHVGYDNTGSLGNNPNARAGHYLFLNTIANGPPAANTLTANQAQRIDSKLDDGVATSGGVFDSANGCDADADGVYDEANQVVSCDLFIRFQN